MPVIRTKQNGEWDRTTTRTPIDDTLTKKGYAADAAAVGAALANTASDAVQYTEQTLTEEQQMQARKNMGLYCSEEVPAEGELVYEYIYTGWWECSGVDTLAQDGCEYNTTYLIEVGGTTYECKPAFMDVYSGGGVYMYKAYLGNFGLYDREGERSNAACPVCFYYYSDDGVVNDFDVAIDPNYKRSMGECISVRIATDEIVTKYDTIPAEYIPDSIARTSAIPTYTSQLDNDSGFITADDIPSGGGITEETDPTVKAWAKTDIPATVGQYFRVSEVDESGNVTAVEAVDAPSGGGECSRAWEHICDITTTEEVDSIEITENADGVPLSELKYNEIWALAKMVGVDTNTTTWWCIRGITDIGRYANNANSGGTAGTKWITSHMLIRGNKIYWNDSNANGGYNLVGGTDNWLANFLDYYNSDHFTKVTVSGGTIGVDTEIRILGRRA